MAGACRGLAWIKRRHIIVKMSPLTSGNLWWMTPVSASCLCGPCSTRCCCMPAGDDGL
uniref:Uncharacterized protein n=1 Tax=Hyaloperonospora arabidopsidis (strain Emoy2) TaxID=559515 RepID=M4BKL3_HYAAE